MTEKNNILCKKEQIWWVKNYTAAYKKSEQIFEKLRSESPQMLKSQNSLILK
jgi:hypothetical protein